MKTTGRLIFASLVFVFLCLLGLWVASDAEAQQYCDPRVDMNCYRRWCAAQGGVVDMSSGVECKVTRRSSPGYSGTNPFEGLFAPFGYLLGEMTRCALGGRSSLCPDDSRSAAIERQRESERQQERATREAEGRRRQQEEFARQQAEQERLRRELEERQRREFEEARNRMLGEMRGMETAVLGPRDFSGSALQVEPSRGSFGTTELRPRDLDTGGASLKPREIEVARPLTSLQRANCARFLLQKANDAVGPSQPIPRYEEAAFLSSQAGLLMSGGSPSVECPSSLPEPPAITGVPLSGSEAQEETLRRRTLLYSALFSRVSQQMADYRVAAAGVREAEEKAQETRRQVEEAQRRKSEVEVQQQQPEPRSPSAMAEALAALQQAEAALAEAEKAAAERKETMSEMERQLQTTRGLAEEAQRNPERTDAILRQLNVNLSANPS